LKYAAKGDASFDAGLNRFVWDMRYPLPSAIPGRPPTAIQPIAKPGTYEARLTVDGVSQTRKFALSMNPNEPYTQEQADERFAFWMELYGNVETSSQNVLAALKLKEDVAARVQAMKDASASAAQIEAAEQQSAVIAEAVDKYESTFVSTGRTLAEIINLPAKIFTRMAWLHNMMEVTEGPVTASMMDVYSQLNALRDAADAEYQEKITEALAKFETAAN